MHHPSKRIVLITGGSSGLGFEMAKQMAAQRSRVIICSRSREKLDIAYQEESRLIPFQCDLTVDKDRESLFQFISSHHNDLNMLVNNAGIAKRFFLEKTNDLENLISQEWQVNYLAPILLTKLFLPLLKKTQGSIVNVTSGLVYAPLNIQPNYCATKAALHSMTQSMRVQFKELGIKVHEIFYPAVDTPFMEGQAPDHAIKADIAAAIALKKLDRGKAEIHVKMARTIFWLSRLMPRKSVQLINKAIPDNMKTLISEQVL